MENLLRMKAEAPMLTLTNQQVYSVCEMARILRKYEAREIWGSEMLYHILGTYLTLTNEDKTAVLEYFKRCGNWRAIEPIYKGLEDHATRNIQTEPKATESDAEIWRKYCADEKMGTGDGSDCCSLD